MPGTPSQSVAPPAEDRGLIRRIAGAVFARKLLFATTALLGLGAGLAFSLLTAGEHTARSFVVVAPLTGGDSSGFLAGVAPRFASDNDVAAEAGSSLSGKTLSAEAVSDAVEVEDIEDGVIELSARDDNARRAADISGAFATAYAAAIREADRGRLDRAIEALQSELALLPDTEDETATVLQARIGELIADRSTLDEEIGLIGPVEVSDPSPAGDLIRHLAVGLLGGLAVGGIIAFVLGGVDRRLRSAEDLERAYGLPVLAKIPRSGMLARGKASSGAELTAASGFNRQTEAFRTLRANLRYYGTGHGLGSILVVSPLAGEGKSTITRVLAGTMAAMGDSVCLVDADLRKGELSSAGADPRAQGLSLVLAGFDLDEALVEVPASVDAVSSRSRVLVELRAGALPPNPSELLESERMTWVMRELERRFGTVLIDTPALASVSDALSLIPRASGVLVVSAVDRTTRGSAVDLRKQLTMLEARQLGVVANNWRPDRELSYEYGRSRSGYDTPPATES